jgi:molecular chaperone GrpE
MQSTIPFWRKTMVFSRDGRPPRGSRRAIPLDQARKIARQRDELAEKFEALRERYEQLADVHEEAEQRTDVLESKLAEAEGEIERLRQQLEEAESSRDESPTPDTKSETTSQADAEHVERLERRVGDLTSDLERVRSNAASTAEEARREERIRLLSELGDVLDSVDRGLSMPMEPAAREGLKAIRAQLVRFFRQEDAELTGEVGTPFEPERHEAIERVEASDVESGSIVAVDRHGLVLEDGTVVQSARVSVAV